MICVLGNIIKYVLYASSIYDCIPYLFKSQKLNHKNIETRILSIQEMKERRNQSKRRQNNSARSTMLFD